MYFRPESQGTYSRLWMVALTEAVTVQWGVGTQLMSKTEIPAKTPRREQSQRKKEREMAEGRKRGRLCCLCSKGEPEPNVVVSTCDASTQEAEAGG